MKGAQGMRDGFIVIARWKDDGDRSITLQNFLANGESFIPIFSDEDAFREQCKGSDFETQGVAIDRALLSSLLHGDELLILDPGGDNPTRLAKADLEKAA